MNIDTLLKEKATTWEAVERMLPIVHRKINESVDDFDAANLMLGLHNATCLRLLCEGNRKANAEVIYHVQQAINCLKGIGFLMGDNARDLNDAMGFLQMALAKGGAA